VRLVESSKPEVLMVHLRLRSQLMRRVVRPLASEIRHRVMSSHPGINVCVGPPPF
jgi:hypothetical protein